MSCESLAMAQRACLSRTTCCQFKLTGKTPMLTRGEAEFAALGVRASGRKKLVSRDDGACPLLGRAGRCTIYAHRPFGCRTHFRAAAGEGVPCPISSLNPGSSRSRAKSSQFSPPTAFNTTKLSTIVASS